MKKTGLLEAVEERMGEGSSTMYRRPPGSASATAAGRAPNTFQGNGFEDSGGQGDVILGEGLTDGLREPVSRDGGVVLRLLHADEVAAFQQRGDARGPGSGAEVEHRAARRGDLD